MSLTRRLIDLARSNLNALLDRAGELSGEERTLEGLSDEALEEELRQRRLAREREAAARAAREADAARGRTDNGSSRVSGRENKIAQYYAQLEVPYGADHETVKQAYRRLMRKYHPDLHSGDAEKQKVATELAQALSRAYSELEAALRAKTGGGA